MQEWFLSSAVSVSLSLVAVSPVLAMTAAQEHNLEEVLHGERTLPYNQNISPYMVSPQGNQQMMVPSPTYRPAVVPDYHRSYANSAYIPLGQPPANMVYRGGMPHAPVSPLINMFNNMLQRSGATPTTAMGSLAAAATARSGMADLPAPSAVSGIYGASPGMVSGQGTNVPVELGGSNPFNLSPFGMLHYMWDDTTYTSPTNPVALYQVQNDLQIAKQQSQLAQSAAVRAKYLTDPAQRAQAAKQAQYYAQQAQMAAQRARNESEAGSLDPAQLATAAGNDANVAAEAANQAASMATSY